MMNEYISDEPSKSMNRDMSHATSQNINDENMSEEVDFHQDINNKVRFLTSLVVWIVGCMLVVPVSVPGIIISVQYSSDKCVQGTTTINIALDAWLLIASIGMVICTILVLIGLCINLRSQILKGFAVFMSIVYTLWTVLGWYLFANSSLECQHDSLWVMSLIYLCVLTTCESCEFIWLLSASNCTRRFFSCKCCKCCGGCKRKCLDLNDIENRVYYNPLPASNFY